MNKVVEPRERLDIEKILGLGASALSSPSNRRWMAWALGGLSAAALMFFTWSYNQTNGVIRYATDAATRGDLVVVVTATGSVQPTNKVDVSSELSGTIRRVLVDYNSAVKAGQTLAELDTDKLQATVDSSRARLTQAQAKVNEADATLLEMQRELMRKRELVAKKISTPRDLDVSQAAHDRAVAALAGARADVGAAEADLKLNETNLTKACICSPINGIVLNRNVDPGQTVASSFQAPILFSIAEDLKKMELQVDVDEADVGEVKVGQTADFSVDAYPDRRFPAKIRDIRFASEIIQGVVTYKAVLDIDNSELLLRPGMTATADVRVAQVGNALLIPNAALRFTPATSDPADQRNFLKRLMPGPPSFRPASQHESTGPNRTIWVLKNGQPAQVDVVVGKSDGKRTEILSGELSAGDAAIVDQRSGTQ